MTVRSVFSFWDVYHGTDCNIGIDREPVSCVHCTVLNPGYSAALSSYTRLLMPSGSLSLLVPNNS